MLDALVSISEERSFGRRLHIMSLCHIMFHIMSLISVTFVFSVRQKILLSLTSLNDLSVYFFEGRGEGGAFPPHTGMTLCLFPLSLTKMNCEISVKKKKKKVHEDPSSSVLLVDLLQVCVCVCLTVILKCTTSEQDFAMEYSSKFEPNIYLLRM